jgi:hypothetical protein
LPLYPLDTKQSWDDLWEKGAEGAWGHPGTRPEVNLNYHRYVILPYDRNKAPKLRAALGWNGNTRLLVYGCGFGWILIALWELGIRQALYGLERSVYVQANKMLNEDDDIRDAIQAVGLGVGTGDGLVLFTEFRDGGNPRSAMSTRLLNKDLSSKKEINELKSILGGPGAEVITYDGYLNTLSDDEVLTLSDQLHDLQPSRVIHHTYTNWTSVGDIQLNAKTPEEWKMLLPNDTIIENGSFRIV